MTDTNNKNEKIYILEWESAELKQNNTCEKFKVVVGEGEENLLFYSTFFADNIKFKKGDIYRLSTSGNFVKDGEVIQKIDGEEQHRKITPSLLIKEFWEEGRKTAEKLDLSEEDLNKKKENVNKLIQELTDTKKELSDLQIKFNETRIEKERIDNERMTPERQRRLLKEQETLKKELEEERNKKQDLINQLEEIQEQSWKKNIQEKLKEEKNKLGQLKISISDKLEIDQKVVLETLLVIQEQFDNLIFEGVDQRICSPMKNQLQQNKDKLVDKNEKISLEEVESICKIQTEIIKLEFQQKQWDKLEEIQKREQQLKAYVEVN